MTTIYLHGPGSCARISSRKAEPSSIAEVVRDTSLGKHLMPADPQTYSAFIEVGGSLVHTLIGYHDDTLDIVAIGPRKPVDHVVDEVLPLWHGTDQADPGWISDLVGVVRKHLGNYHNSLEFYNRYCRLRQDLEAAEELTDCPADENIDVIFRAFPAFAGQEPLYDHNIWLVHRRKFESPVKGEAALVAITGYRYFGLYGLALYRKQAASLTACAVLFFQPNFLKLGGIHIAYPGYDYPDLQSAEFSTFGLTTNEYSPLMWEKLAGFFTNAREMKELADFLLKTTT